MNDLVAVVAAGAAVGLYFLPIIIAGRKRKRQTSAIAVLDLFLGWTFIGWVAALVWATTND